MKSAPQWTTTMFAIVTDFESHLAASAPKHAKRRPEEFRQRLARAKNRREAAESGVVTLCLIALWERLGWWHMVIPWEPYFLALSLICLTLCAFIFLITWRIARRFGWRGLVVVLVVLAVIGPLRDQWFMRRFPELGNYGPGIAPVLAISASSFC
jgi:hypothetical protein